MELKGAEDMWKRSEETRKMRYMNVIADGDNDTWGHLNKIKPYGPNKFIEKEECIQHVGKRLTHHMNELQKVVIVCEVQKR